MKGVPLRIEIGPKDIEKNQCVVVRRDNREKVFVPLDELEAKIPELLKAVHDGLYEKALKNRENRTYTALNMDEMIKTAEEKSGFIKAMWCGDPDCEMKLKEIMRRNFPLHPLRSGRAVRRLRMLRQASQKTGLLGQSLLSAAKYCSVQRQTLVCLCFFMAFFCQKQYN